jgi:hypothetical protein
MIRFPLFSQVVIHQYKNKSGGIIHVIFYFIFLKSLVLLFKEEGKDVCRTMYQAFYMY